MSKLDFNLRKVVTTSMVLAIGASTWCPQMAWATTGWEGKIKAFQDANKYQKSVTPSIVTKFISPMITTCCGIAIIIFIVKVVLTAIDRMLFVGDANRSRLDQIPVVGAYPNPEKASGGGQGGSTQIWTWKRIWIHFAIQITLCVSAYLITTLLMQVLATLFSTSTASTTPA